MAEVLDPLDRQRIEAAFAVRVEQIYQATEGFLGATCEHGVIHLNEEFLIVEREWVDEARTRFVPVITDLYRSSQPIIRYRLNDVLVPRRGRLPVRPPDAGARSYRRPRRRCAVAAARARHEPGAGVRGCDLARVRAHAAGARGLFAGRNRVGPLARGRRASSGSAGC